MIAPSKQPQSRDTQPAKVTTTKARVTSYQALLQEPTAHLVGSLTDRPDVATAAILGYN